MCPTEWVLKCLSWSVGTEFVLEDQLISYIKVLEHGRHIASLRDSVEICTVSPSGVKEKRNVKYVQGSYRAGFAPDAVSYISPLRLVHYLHY